jgi:phosphate-selective porin OprO and OprP
MNIRILSWTMAATLLAVTAVNVHAQAPESELPPLPGTFTPDTLLRPESGFALPDLGPKVAASTSVTSPWFVLKPGLVLIVDHTAFGQDATNVEQVGAQQDQSEIRAARAMLRGTVGRGYKVAYLVSGEYKGFETDPASNWQMTDISITLPLHGPATKLTLGKTKETFGYEMVGDAANLPHLERVLNPFFVSRNVGARLMHVTKDHRMTLGGGVYNDAFITGKERQLDVSARITRLLVDDPATNRFLHLGLSGRRAGTTNGTLRYQGRPESNVASNFVNSGDIVADGATHAGLELLWNRGPLSFTGEYMHAWVDAGTAGDPRFSGGYLTASYVLTGETRPYDRTVGYARRVMPKRRWGAPELVARFSAVDLEDATVRGGTYTRFFTGINWWGSHRWRASAGWGRTWLERAGKMGTENSLLLRLQWVY